MIELQTGTERGVRAVARRKRIAQPQPEMRIQVRTDGGVEVVGFAVERPGKEGRSPTKGVEQGMLRVARNTDIGIADERMGIAQHFAVAQRRKPVLQADIRVSPRLQPVCFVGEPEAETQRCTQGVPVDEILHGFMMGCQKTPGTRGGNAPAVLSRQGERSKTANNKNQHPAFCKKCFYDWCISHSGLCVVVCKYKFNFKNQFIMKALFYYS